MPARRLGIRTVAAFFLSMALLGACGVGRYPFLQVQMCLGDAQNLEAFRREMQAIAQAQRMTFDDQSARAQSELDVVDNEHVAHDPRGPVLELSVRTEDGWGVSAGNIGLSRYEVSLGFSEGDNPAEARRFADLVVRRLSQRWRVMRVPDDRGALPMPECRM